MRRRPAFAFTLVELLVVIGVIAVLVALLLPSMKEARRQAVRVKCAAHMRQIGAAVAMYAGEHKGAIPIAFRYPADGWPHGYHWFSHLAPYVQKGVSEDEIAGSRDASVLWGCPQWERDPRPWTDNGFHWGISWKIGYGYNALPQAPQRPTPEPTDSMLINPVAAKGRYFKLSEIRHHSDRGMVADAREIFVCVYYPWDPTVPVERQQFSHLDPTRHGGWKQTGGCNVLFYDGHVSALSPRELYYAFGDPIRSDPP